MHCAICSFLKDSISLTLQDGSSVQQYEELCRLAQNHYRRYHPNPFDIAMTEFRFMNERG